jgi:hypothetical protein
MSRSRALAKSAMLWLLLASQAAWAQVPPGPRGMYSGVNEVIQFSRPIRARSLRGTVFYGDDETVAAARIQVQRQGSDALVVDITADENGRFRLPSLEPGAYWLGITKSGCKLNVWDLHIVRFGWSKHLKSTLSLGT